MTPSELRRYVDDGLSQVAHVLATGTAETQLHAAAEHIRYALSASAANILALVTDPDAVYIVGDSEEVVTSRIKISLDQVPHVRRAFETCEVIVDVLPPTSETAAVFPIAAGRKPIGALVVRFGDLAAPVPEDAITFGRLAAALIGIVLRSAKALDPIRERTRKIVADVHERRLKAIERYRAFIDSASDGIVVLDASGRVLYLNRAAEEVTGYARDGLAGKPLIQIAREAHRAGLEVEIQRAVGGQPIDNFDLDLITTSGDVITVSVASIGILSEYQAAIFAFRDVTVARELERELRRTTEFLERILNSTVDGIIAADMRGKILLFNQGAERISGFKATEVIGAMSIKDLYPPGAAQELMQLIRSLEHGGGGRLEPMRRDLRSKSGELVPVQISAALVFDDEGREIATVGIFSDLRERLTMEERLALAQEKLAITEKQAVAIELAGAAAHELNQPLTSVMGYAQMLIRKIGAQDPQIRRIIETILQEAERMAGIVRQIGSLTRYETKSYVGGAQIIDLDKSSPREGQPPRGK